MEMDMQRSEMGRETSKRKERHGGGGEEIEQGIKQRRQYQMEGKGGKSSAELKGKEDNKVVFEGKIK